MKNDHSSLGYDQFLQKSFQDDSWESNSLQFDLDTSEVSGSKLTKGVIHTANGLIDLSLEEGYFQVSDGKIYIIRKGGSL